MLTRISRDVFQNWDIVVVDDDPASLDIVSILMKHYGARVHSATNGQEGLDKATAVRPRLILSDMSMPVMDGWQMIARLKEQPETRHIPIIALTAHAMLGDRERIIAAGFHNYMSKPLAPSTFIPELLRLLAEIPELGITKPKSEGQ